ncbi:hypothetical protein BDV59DRAFT_188525 [Aspergillus ambiguus]|uniref:uncharacterized protein n=1 Tax=Aspergillus ambiguus TaxID=176160 RepID=UPI003CCD45E9
MSSLIGFEREDDDNVLHLFASAFGSELAHLKYASPTVESGTKPLVENVWTPSRVIFGEDFTEVNRTLVSMLAVKWLLADQYDIFTGGQPARNKLTRESFHHLRQFLLDRNPSSEDISALLVALAIDDIGKDPTLTKTVEEKLSSPAQDHSEVVLCAARDGLIPSLAALRPDKQAAVLQNLQIGSKLNIAQLVQAETAPASLAILQDSLVPEDRQDGFSIRAVVTLLDVAGAAAHRDPRGCIVMTEPVFQPYMETITILDEFRKGTIPTPRACYDRILSYRAEVLHRNGYSLLSPAVAQERALLRLLCMGRVEDKGKARLFQQALEELDPFPRENLVNGLNVDGIEDGTAVLPYYAPGILAESLRNVPDQSDASVVKVLMAFMRFLSRVFDGSKPIPGSPGDLVKRDLAFARDTVHSDAFRENPGILDALR